jgi:subfamily B ATP-binding cassette protein MsbA
VKSAILKLKKGLKNSKPKNPKFSLPLSFSSNEMKDFFTIYKLSVHNKWKTFLVVFYNFLFVIFNLISFVLFVPFLQLIFQTKSSEIELVKKPLYDDPNLNIFEYLGELYNYEKQQMVLNDPKQALLIVCISVVIAFFLKNVCRYLAIYHNSSLKMEVVRDLRDKLFAKSLRLPMSFFTEEKKGDLMARLNNDIGEIEFAVTSMIELVFREPFAIALSLITLIYWSPQLTLISLVLLPLSAFTISRIGKSLKRTAKKGQEQMGILLSSIEENFGGIRIIKAFNAGEYIRKSFTNINLRHQQLVTKTYRKKDLSSPLNEFLGTIVMICIVWFGGSMILDAKNSSGLTGEEFIAFIIVFSQLLRPIQGIATGIANIHKAEVSYRRVEEILAMEEQIYESQNPHSFAGLQNEISFENVSFKYKEEFVIQDLSFKIPKGKMVALVGESGSGKSTIADLLLNFYQANSGDIYFDGIPLKDIKNEDLRNQISVVNQESILFNDTIKNNIAFGLENCSDERVMEAARIAHAHDFIMNLENGYDTNIGERGNKLSGGQKQRISIARAILRNPSILILDEATSALDSESEKIVQQALEELMVNRTSLVIAHRLSTIARADLILVLQKGKIIEQGTHQELLQAKGYYADMYALILNS